jgi:hypothetical protein
VTAVAAPAGITFDATVARQLAHRSSVEGVFVTGTARAGDRLIAGGQLPRIHRLHNDVTGRHHDTLMLAEVIRQAIEVIAHGLLDVPLARVFVLRSIRVRVDDPTATVAGSDVTRFAVEVPAAQVRRRRNGAVHAIAGPARCLLDGVPAATFDGTVSFLPPDVYDAVRADGPVARRRSIEKAGTASVPPGAVGRHLDANVLITAPTGPAHAATADLRPSRHPVFFDRPLDHYPGMMLAEAARQLALAVSGGDPATLRTDTADVEFIAFAELDDTVRLRVTERTALDGGGTRVGVAVEQAGGTLSRAAFTFGVDR